MELARNSPEARYGTRQTSNNHLQHSETLNQAVPGDGFEIFVVSCFTVFFGIINLVEEVDAPNPESHTLNPKP